MIFLNGTIYLVENLINGRSYIGQTIQIWPLRKYQHYNNHEPSSLLSKALDKYGKTNFKWKILEKNIKTQKMLNFLEKFHIIHNKTNVNDGGYNLHEGGSNGKPNEETLKKMSESHKGLLAGEKHPLFGKRGKDNPNYGRKCSEETKMKLRLAQLGKKHSIHSRKKMSMNNKGMLNKNHSSIACKKMSLAKRGKYPGAYFKKQCNPERKCWVSQIQFKGIQKTLGFFEDPISASIVYNLVWDEIYENIVE